MYCPSCATPLAAKEERCPSCDFDVAPVARLMGHTQPLHDQRQRWAAQRDSIGLLLVMCSLLVGCLIPIAIGVLGDFSGLGSLIVTLAGLAGLLMILGSMLLMASEGSILTPARPTPPAPQLPTNDDAFAATEPARQPVRR